MIKTKEDAINTLGVYLFIAGIVIALIVGLLAGVGVMAVGGWVYYLMVILGLIVGALNVNDKEVNSFIIAAIGLTVGSTALTTLGIEVFEIIFRIFVTFVASAVFIPALKAVYKLSRD